MGSDAYPPSTSGERRTLTALFVDIRGLARVAARVTPDQAVAVINAIFVRLGEVIESERGVVNRVLGSGLLALFGAPLPLDDHATVAARAALAIRASLDRQAGEPHGRPTDLEPGFGLNTGTVIAGRICSPPAGGYTVVGHAVTVASRLGASATPGQILIGPGTAALLSSEFDIRDRGIIELAGTGPTAVFELVR